MRDTPGFFLLLRSVLPVAVPFLLGCIRQPRTPIICDLIEEDDYRLPEGVRPITHRLKDVGYYTANLKTMNGEEIGSGKLDLNFVNEGKLYDGSKWEELKKNQPFFAQMNTLECEYDIYDRNTWRQPS